MPILFKVGFKHILTFGKYKGLSVLEVYGMDPEYLLWLHENTELRFKKKVLYEIKLACIEQDTGTGDKWDLEY